MSPRVGAVATAAAFGAGLAALAVTLTSPHEELRAVGHPDNPVMGPLIGWTFTGAGLVAWWVRPDNRFGKLMYATGLAWFASALIASGSAPLFTVGQLITPLWVALFLHTLLAFPSGRLETPARRLLVLTFYIDLTLVHAAWTMFSRSEGTPGCAGCPENLLMVADQPAIADAVLIVEQLVIGSVVIGGTVAVLVHQWRVASRPQRRALAPVLPAGIACLAVLALTLAAEPFSYALGQSVGWFGALAFTAVPIAFLAGLLRQRLERSRVGHLVTELGGAERPRDLETILRASLDDPTLRVGFWRADSHAYVDAAGRPVPLPAPGSGQVATTVERAGRRIAALVHDGSLAENPALVSGVAAAAGLALENQQLHAEVRAQLSELHASRRRLVQAGDLERRRLERNLHDGAQQRLLGVSLLINQLDTTAGDEPEVQALVDKARTELRTSMSELREIARGLHPATLTDHGLVVALEGVAASSPLPVRMSLDVPHRAPPPAEVAAYYVVSEAVANVVKHAQAHEVTVSVRLSEGALLVEVTDDGVGGASTAGSGLQGLGDRVAALDGTLTVVSPCGGGTRVRARIPCE